jgi:hypothetical protein
MGQPDGQLTVKNPNGGVYVGEYKNGNRHGQGTYIWNDGPFKSYRDIGEWKDHERTGYRRYIFGQENPNWAGHVYEGDFLNGKHHGQGTYIFPSGDVYEGERKDNARNASASEWVQRGLWQNGVFVDP